MAAETGGVVTNGIPESVAQLNQQPPASKPMRHQQRPAEAETHRPILEHVAGSESPPHFQGSSPPVFRAFVTPPPQEAPFTFPTERTSAGTFHQETEPKTPYHETGSSYPYPNTIPKYPYPGTEHLSQDADPQLPYQETDPKRPYHETDPKRPYQEVDPKYPYPGTDPTLPYQETEPKRPYRETAPKYPYPTSPSNGSDPASEAEPRLAGSTRHPADPDRRYPYGETQPKRVGSARRQSEAAPPRTRLLSETSRSRSEDPLRLAEDACLDSEDSSALSVRSDMRGLQAHVRDSSHVHVGTKVYDQRNIVVERLDSHVDNVHRHEHVQEKHEHIRNKHEHVHSKTEVHNRTENIKHEHIQTKHEHYQMNTTEIVHNQAETIYAENLHVHYDCLHGSSSVPRLEEPFQEGRRYLATRYTSWTTLSTPLPWYDDMVLDVGKSCIDFSMVSMGCSTTTTYNGVEELVREQLQRTQQPEKALRVIVEGHAGYGKTTLAAKVAYDWATGCEYLSQFSHAFLIFLREFDGSLDDHIRLHHYPQELDDADAFLQYLKTNQERVLFIFDGYDELPKERREAVDQIMLGRAFVHSGAVMTSRPMSMTFKKYCQFVSLKGFDSSKKRDFVRLVYRDRPQMPIDEFLTVLERDRSAAELAQCPLMCLLLCELHQRGAFGGRATRSQLYEELFHYLVCKAVHRWLAQPCLDDRARLEAAYDEALSEFGAFCLQCLALDQLCFTEQDIPKSCEAAKLFDVGFIVKCIGSGSMGLQCSRGPSQETFYEPIHKTFMEFLAAKHLQSIAGEEDRLKRELVKLKQGTNPATEKLVLQFFCGLLKADAWTVMEQLDVDDFGLDFMFSLLREAGESPENVAAVCRHLPRKRVTVRGADNHLDVWALCLSSPASEVYDIEFIWDFDASGRPGTPSEFVAAQLSFWSALQSCSNVTDLRVTFLYGHSSEVPPEFLDALAECMKNCARLAKLAVLHVKAVAPDSAAESFLPVVDALSQHVRSCTSLHRLTVDVNLSSKMTGRLCGGLVHVPRLETLRLPRLYCDVAGFSALAELIRRHVSIKTLEVSVILVDGPVDFNTPYSQLNRDAIVRNKKLSVSPDAVMKTPLHRAGPGRVRTASDHDLRTRSEPDRARTGPDQELEYLKDVLAVSLKDEKRVRVVEGIWYLVDQTGPLGRYPLPMCDRISHKGGYHQLLEAVRASGSRLETLTIGRESLARMDFVCLGETIRKSESITQLVILDIERAVNVFPLITALPAAKRLEAVFLRSPRIQVNDFLFSVFCRCLEHNRSLQGLNIQQWKFQLESSSSIEYLKSLLKNTSLKRLDLSECRVSLACRLDEPQSPFPCASISSLNLADCSLETPAGMVRGAAFLPMLQGLSALKQLDLSHKAAPQLTDAAVKAFFAGLAAFKTLQELAICGWKYDIANPEAVYNETKAAARKLNRLTKVYLDNSQFSARSSDFNRQWLVQAMATGVPHLQELRFALLMRIDSLGTSALTATQVDSLAKAIGKAKWTGRALVLYMPQHNSSLVDLFVHLLTRISSRIVVTSDGKTVTLKRYKSGQWWQLRPRP